MMDGCQSAYGSNPALQVYDFVMEHGALRRRNGRPEVSVTTLDGLLSTPSVRKALGFAINKKELETELPPEEALKPLKRLILESTSRRLHRENEGCR
jgi:hypothetical protein